MLLEVADSFSPRGCYVSPRFLGEGLMVSRLPWTQELCGFDSRLPDERER